MSADATGWVYRHSPYKGAVFAVHHAVADSVNDQHGNEFWMAMGNLAIKARISRQTASEAVGQLTADGFIELLEERPGESNRYLFLFPDVPVVYETRRKRVSAEATPNSGEVSPGATGGVGDGDTIPSDPKGKPPNPPQAGGSSSHRGQHTNCRACGTNPRGPAPLVPPAVPVVRERGGQPDCAYCEDTGWSAIVDGVAQRCTACDPSRRVS